MSSFQRIWNFALSLLMIACGFVLLFYPEDGLVAVALVLGIALVVHGVRKLVYYLTMARHMVGGISVLFFSVITIDIGACSLLFVNDPRVSIVLFLVCYNAYTGVLAIARGIESKLFESSWLFSVAHGVVNLMLASACITFINSDQIIIAIFCVDLFYIAIVRLVSVFKPTEIIYIQ